MTSAEISLLKGGGEGHKHPWIIPRSVVTFLSTHLFLQIIEETSLFLNFYRGLYIGPKTVHPLQIFFPLPQ
jgi:hypothetical protein